MLEEVSECREGTEGMRGIGAMFGQMLVPSLQGRPFCDDEQATL